MRVSSISLVLTVASCVPASAFINPDFTPVHLCREAEGIYVVVFSPASDDGKATARIETVLKGKGDVESYKFDFLAGAFEAKGRKVMKMIAGPHKRSLLFTGAFQAGSEDAEADEDVIAKALLHVGKDWVVLSSYEPGLWEMEDIDQRLLGTWAGSTEMLTRAVKYILADEDADVPVNSGVQWTKPVKLALFAGEVTGIRPVDLAGDGKVTLHLACKAGDRLIAYDPAGKSSTDLAAGRKLAARSSVAAWGDFDGNGSLDLASWDGAGLSLHLQQADGTFAAKSVELGEAMKGKCLSLDTIGCGKGKVALVAGTERGPVLVTFDKDLKPQAGNLAGKCASPAQMGKPGKCVVADLDGDALTDVLQFFEAGGLFYKAKSDGVFSAPVKTDVAAGKGRSELIVGDFDMDGLLDVLACAEDGNRLWRNLGGGKFVEMLAMSGEIEYIARRGAIGGWTGDVNNDGRQDLLMLYGDGGPQMFFNRGFNSFGHARMLDVIGTRLLVPAGEGQQAGCLADVNADGALDLVLVLTDGSVWLLPRKIKQGSALAVAVAIGPALGRAGPVNVIGRQERRCFGAYPLRAGEPGVLFGLREPGPVMVTWKLPNGKQQADEVFLEAGPVRMLLGGKN